MNRWLMQVKKVPTDGHQLPTPPILHATTSLPKIQPEVTATRIIQPEEKAVHCSIGPFLEDA